ncbi:ferritin [Plakobranchus ocellatus]|uniref:Ferritin n=1 Tax=Plakobranchus ocellatus TaxID=259542 RepID=A0AAV3ZS58_9GAST|nr:ferritin [Plakobranchus ocellatus]
MSQVRQNFSEDCEAGINRQINLELYASYVYQSIAHYFDQDDVALRGFVQFFKRQSDEEREHAEALMEYQNKRGGQLKLQDVQKPETNSWGSGKNAMRTALNLEKKVNESLIDLHHLAESKGDSQMCDFLDGFLTEQVEAIKKMADLVKQVTGVGEGLGEYLFDKKTLQKMQSS